MNKSRFNNCVLALLLSGAVLTAPSASALSAKRANELRKLVTSVPVPEMPAKAAQLVQEAKPNDRKEVAVTVVRAAISKRKASGPVVVAAISKVAPDLAATVATVASQIVSDQSSYIAQAAISAAPGESDAILAALSAPVAQGTRTEIAPASAVASGNRTTELSPVLAASQPQGAGSTTPNTGAVTPITSAVNPSRAEVTPVPAIAITADAAPSARPNLPPVAATGAITENTPPQRRGEADVSGPSSGSIVASTQPINRSSGGRGDGQFPTFAPAPAPAPHAIDYSAPRH